MLKAFQLHMGVKCPFLLARGGLTAPTKLNTVLTLSICNFFVNFFDEKNFDMHERLPRM